MFALACRTAYRVLPALLLCFIAPLAHAGKTGSYETRHGGTYTYSTQAGGGQASGSVTGPRGYTTQGSAGETYGGHGAYDVNGTVTGPRGKTGQGSATVTP